MTRARTIPYAEKRRVTMRSWSVVKKLGTGETMTIRKASIDRSKHCTVLYVSTGVGVERTDQNRMKREKSSTVRYDNVAKELNGR